VVDQAAEPAWSPGGRRIAFTRPVNGKSEVCVVRVASGATRCLGDGEDVSWSATGALAVLRWRDWPQRSALFVLRADGTHARQLNIGGNRWFDGPVQSLDWAPDGRKLVFVRGRGVGDPDQVQRGINVLDLRLGTTRRVWRGANPESAVFSPDGARIAYVENNNEELGADGRVLRTKAAVYTIGLSGQGRRVLFRPPRFHGQRFVGLDWQALPPRR
jgi:Tol biopolymer transport system component